MARAKALNGETLERIYGYAVRSSLPRLREANEMRRVIETGIARLAAQRRDRQAWLPWSAPSMKCGLGSEIRRISPRPTSFFTSGSRMATGNSMIRVQMEGHALGPTRGVGAVLTPREQDACRLAGDHRATLALYEAVAAGDAALAEQCIARHYAAADIASLKVTAEPPKGKARQ